MSILNAARLTKLSSYSNLSNSWYYIACATLTVCNEPQEIQKVLHYALKKSILPSEQKNESSLLQLADSSLKSSALYQELHLKGNSLPDLANDDPLTTNQQEIQVQVAQKTREALLKCVALAGLPKVINSLMLLKNVTPLDLREKKTQRSFDISDIQEERERGMEFWNKVYGKISKRVTNQMESAYPDLWYYTINHVYSPLLSFSNILSPRESSLVVIACLIPLDVNPQLKGHLKGALNNGCTKEEIEETRKIAIEIGDWCGIKWKGDIAKL